MTSYKSTKGEYIMQFVTLLDGIFKESQEKGKEYLIYLDVDRLVAPVYEAAAQTPKNLVTAAGNQHRSAGTHWTLAFSRCNHVRCYKG